ncbi:hypothetical protein [Pseudactinotalea sp. HY158]|uniref:hypothetical protein n=1 Tax=Pseudactinotalea sp. HY158 TaxID=2654547 RepID=UPI00129C8CC6|nr:hypothetical protein [Pseudactinotalea sp. HY158]QGH68149.1 hypothetical protein GCE65_00385 [Pseudactinotalea sp. HY158]
MAVTSSRSWLAPFVVLTLVTAVDVIRAAWADAIFFAVAIVLAAVQTRSPRRPRHALAGRAPIAAIVGTALAALLVLTFTPRHGLGAGVVVCLLGAATVTVAVLGGWPRGPSGLNEPAPAVDHRRGDERGDPGLRRAGRAWGAIIVLAGLWELTAYLTWRWGVLADGIMPSISDVLDPILDTFAGKAAFAAIWLAGGAGLLIRAWRTGEDRCA